MVREIAGTALTTGRFVEVEADKGWAARFSAWVLVGAIFRLMVRARSILSLKQNCYKLCTLVKAARIMPCDSVLRFI